MKIEITAFQYGDVQDNLFPFFSSFFISLWAFFSFITSNISHNSTSSSFCSPFNFVLHFFHLHWLGAWNEPFIPLDLLPPIYFPLSFLPILFFSPFYLSHCLNISPSTFSVPFSSSLSFSLIAWALHTWHTCSCLDDECDGGILPL